MCFWEMDERDAFLVCFFFCENRYFDEALDLYQRMLWVGIRPDVYTFPCVLEDLWGLPDWRMGREIHAHVIRFIYDSEIDVVNALITMYVKCGDVCSARVLFNIMSKRDRILGMLAVQECCYDFGYESRLNFNSGLIHLLASV